MLFRSTNGHHGDCDGCGDETGATPPAKLLGRLVRSWGVSDVFQCRHGAGVIKKGLVRAVLLERITAGPWQTNTYVVAAAPGAECVLVDPGFDSEPLIELVLARHELTPAGIVLTHGHLDHVASVPDIARRHGLAVWIHPDDEVLLSDPAAGLSPDSKP